MLLKIVYHWKASYKMKLSMFLIQYSRRNYFLNIDNIVVILFNISGGFFSQFEAYIIYCFQAHLVLDLFWRYWL